MNVNKTTNVLSIELKRLALLLVLILQLSLSGIFSLAEFDGHLSIEGQGQCGFSVEHVYAEDADDKSLELSSESPPFYKIPAKRFLSITSAPPENFLHGSTNSRSPPEV